MAAKNTSKKGSLTPVAEISNLQNENSELWKKRFPLILLCFCFLLYGNTMWNGYSMDDELVASNNKLVEKGFYGIPKIFTSRYAVNEKQNYEYRPIAVTTYAIEFQLMGSNPAFSHFLNVLLYALTGVVLFFLLLRMFKNEHWFFPGLITLIFIVHPIHSEVVNSLKNRDEILAFLFGLLAIRSVLIYTENKKWRFLAYGFLLVLLSLLSKKSFLTIIAALPLIIYFFSSINIKKLIGYLALALIAFVVYKLIIRGLFPRELTARHPQYFENPLYVDRLSFFERIPFAFHTVGFYIVKLILPYPLVVYYGYNCISLGEWSDPLTIFGVIATVPLTVWCLINFRKKSPFIFGWLFFVITISMYANLVVPAVGIVAERFAYIPSLGLIIMLVSVIAKYSGMDMSNPKAKINLIPQVRYGLIAVGLVCTVYIINRNTDWKSHFSIYYADIQKVPESAKLNSLLGSHYAQQLDQWRMGKLKMRPEAAKQKADSAIYYFSKALEIYPDYSACNNNIGTMYFTHMNNSDSARKYFEKAIELDSVYTQALFNLGSCYEKDIEVFDLMESVLNKSKYNTDSIKEGNLRIQWEAALQVFGPLRNLEKDLTAFIQDLIASKSKEVLDSKLLGLPNFVDRSMSQNFPKNGLRPDRDSVVRVFNGALQKYFSNEISGTPEDVSRFAIASVAGQKYTDHAVLSYYKFIDSVDAGGQVAALKFLARSEKQIAIYRTANVLNRALDANKEFMMAFDKLNKMYQKYQLYDSVIVLNTRFLEQPKYQHEQLMINIANVHFLKNNVKEGIDWYLKAAKLDSEYMNRLAVIHNHLVKAKSNSAAGFIYTWYNNKKTELKKLYDIVAGKYNEMGDAATAQQYYTLANQLI